MATIGSLFVTIAADTTALVAGMERAQAAVEKWANVIKGTLIVGAALELNAMLDRMLEKAGNFAKTVLRQSEILGISAEQLQIYREVAARSKLETEEFSTAMQRFAGNLANAAKGHGDLADASRKYGIGIVDAAGKSLQFDAALRNIADRVKNAKTQAEALEITYAAFGKRSLQMVEFLKQGSSGFDQIARDAQRMGLVLSEATLKGAEEAKQKWELASRIIDANVIRFFAQLAPTVTRLAEALADAAPQIALFTQRLSELFGLIEKTSGSKLLDDVAMKIESLKSDPDRFLGIFKGRKEIEEEIKKWRAIHNSITLQLFTTPNDPGGLTNPPAKRPQGFAPAKPPGEGALEHNEKVIATLGAQVVAYDRLQLAIANGTLATMAAEQAQFG